MECLPGNYENNLIILNKRNLVSESGEEFYKQFIFVRCIAQQSLITIINIYQTEEKV